MKMKIVFSLFFLCLIKALGARDYLVEVKAGYDRPVDHRFHEIYGAGGIYGAEFSMQAYKYLYGWVSADIFHDSGTSVGGGYDTSITLVPLGVGLKMLIPIKCCDFYFGGGVLPTYGHIENHSPYVVKSQSKWGVGGILKIGGLYNFLDHFFIDLFYNYTILNMDFPHHTHKTLLFRDANLNAWAVGAGIGYRFGGCR